jgi:hypothetical protein
MSTFYKESNSEKTESLYDKTIMYRGELATFAQRYSCLVDFNFAEKYLYGRVDRDYVSIEVNEALVSLTTIPNADGDAGQVKVINFVADAFAGLSRHFQRSTQIGAIRKTDPYLSNLKAYAGYTNTEQAYANYFNSLIEAMSRVKKDKSLNFKDFNEFMGFVTSFSRSVGKTFPITKPGFVRSRFNSVMNNGVSIEISDLSYENDDQKIQDFVGSPNFEYYLNACNSYGFMVDINFPWRLVADLDSVAMNGYANRYGYTSTDAILITAYKKSHNSYYREFKQNLLNIYNNLSKKYTIIDKCSNKSIIVEPKVYNIESINELYDESYFTRFYCMLRFLEEENKLSEAQQQQTINDTVSLSRVRGERYALSRFERFTAQPFDYRGSLSYLVKASRNSEAT